MKQFADRLLNQIRLKKTPLMIGLDPRLERLPADLRAGVSFDDPVQVADRYETFCRQIIDIVANRVAVVKPQFAFFEQLGPIGMTALKNVVDHARSQDLIVIGDAKRGDIGSTAEGYANAYLSRTVKDSIACDALTVNPYMGFDTIEPFLEVAEQHAGGIFVLVKTSNPGSGQLQDLESKGTRIYERVARQVQSLAEKTTGEAGYGIVGAVVGATYPEQLNELRKIMTSAFLLIPGFGAQGGSATDVAAGFDKNGEGAIVNSSRGIIFAYEQERFRESKDDWQRCVESALDESIGAIQLAIDSAD